MAVLKVLLEINMGNCPCWRGASVNGSPRNHQVFQEEVHVRRTGGSRGQVSGGEGSHGVAV